jgi:hypothetical protein
LELTLYQLTRKSLAARYSHACDKVSRQENISGIFRPKLLEGILGVRHRVTRAHFSLYQRFVLRKVAVG